MLKRLLDRFAYVREKDLEIQRLGRALESAAGYEESLEGLRVILKERIKQLERENAELKRHLSGGHS